MKIRYLEPSDDRKAVSRIYENSWKYAYKGIIPDGYLDSIREGRWAGNLDIQGWSTLVLLEDGEYVGTCSFSAARSPEYPGSGEIISIYLLPEYTGRGYGAMLLETALCELGKQGYDDVYLWVLEENWNARRFYEKNGFEFSGDIAEITIGGKVLREVRYVFRFS